LVGGNLKQFEPGFALEADGENVVFHSVAFHEARHAHIRQIKLDFCWGDIVM
jgi:hypothetical protein